MMRRVQRPYRYLSKLLQLNSEIVLDAKLWKHRVADSMLLSVQMRSHSIFPMTIKCFTLSEWSSLLSFLSLEVRLWRPATSLASTVRSPLVDSETTRRTSAHSHQHPSAANSHIACESTRAHPTRLQHRERLTSRSVLHTNCETLREAWREDEQTRGKGHRRQVRRSTMSMWCPRLASLLVLGCRWWWATGISERARP